jgi:hypothetical protein
MANIQLHTPTHMQDSETTTEYEANDIVHVSSVVGNDLAEGTHFYLRGVPEKQFCLEPARTVKQLVTANKNQPTQPAGGNQLHFHGNIRGNIVQTTGAVQVDSPNATQQVHVTINQPVSATIEKLREAVKDSDLDDFDKEEIEHNLDRVRRLADAEPTEKSKSSILDKLAAVEKMVTISEKLSKLAAPLVLALRAHFG